MKFGHVWSGGGFKDEGGFWARWKAKEVRNSELGMTTKLCFYGKVRPENLYWNGPNAEPAGYLYALYTHGPRWSSVYKPFIIVNTALLVSYLLMCERRRCNQFVTRLPVIWTRAHSDPVAWCGGGKWVAGSVVGHVVVSGWCTDCYAMLDIEGGIINFMLTNYTSITTM